ncbi:hypothetical protein LR48_Vigan843s000300 [Vigna angularis]|uniref:Uncharacterized protein n=1 Tax=Phaseolus angularis TaxID=3914 RepID=A0A0L9THL5_PHAAN|nr:hypothetical protein LR48_Vigan843s000300 [Vigna angularis]
MLLPNAHLPLLTPTRMIIAMTRRTYKYNGQHKENERVSLRNLTHASTYNF